jgi:hypothetical protein
MAQRRMFSQDIVSSDAFLDMPISSQVLYFHLAVRADDDGFVSPKMVMRVIGSSSDDLKVLITKRFLLPFESGVVVIKHWLIHNLIRADLYKETLYKKEKSMLGLNENGAYTELRDGVTEIKKIESPKWLKQRRGELRTANVPQTVHRLGKDRLGKDSIEENSVESNGKALLKVTEKRPHKRKKETITKEIGETSSPELKTNNLKNLSWNNKSDDFEEGVVDLDGDGSLAEIKKTPTRKYPNAPAVRKVFQEVLGKNEPNWKLNKTQLQACENLYTGKGLDKLRNALEFYVDVKDQEFCPTIDSPYDLDSKYDKLARFKKKTM